MSIPYLIPGVDLLSLPCITPADVQQAIAAAIPANNIGFVIVLDTAPDVIATPELARFIWLKSILGIPTGQFYFYDGVAWTLLSTIDGANIAPGTIPLSKFSLVGASAYNIIQVNSTNTGLIWTSIINAIQNGTIPLNKLVPGAAGNFVLTSLAGVNDFITIASLVTYFAANTIPIDKLVKGGVSTHGLFLRTFEDGTVIEWADFDPNEQIDDGELEIAKLSGDGYGSLQAIRRNSANTGWEPFTPVLLSSIEAYDTNTALADVKDITLVKPTGKAWRTFEVMFTGCFTTTRDDVLVDFTWETAPIAGTSLGISSVAGAGNGGQVFTSDNPGPDFGNITPTWWHKGTFPVQLSTTNSVVIRATVTKGTLTNTSSVFAGKGIRDA